ncbi:hypothetical protein, partial [Staphylococcus delphini]
LVDANALSASLVVLPFDTLWLNESTADVNSLASVLTASLCDVEALVEVDTLVDSVTLTDANTDCSIDVISDAVLLLEALLLNESLVDANALSASLVV